MKQNIRTVTHENGTVKTFTTDEEFLNYAREVYKENEEGNPYPSEIYWLPENIGQATEYIHEWCGNLELNEQ